MTGQAEFKGHKWQIGHSPMETVEDSKGCGYSMLRTFT